MSEDIKIYHVETQEDYDDLMIKLENKGYLWASGDILTSKPQYWNKSKENTAIILNSYRKRCVTRDYLDAVREVYPNTPVIKHEAKGVEQMEKVVVPQFVATWFEENKGGLTIYGLLHLFSDNYFLYDGFRRWVEDYDINESEAQDIMAKMYLFQDYEIEVEEEKKYHWRKKKSHTFDLDPSIYINVTEYGRVFFSDETVDDMDFKTEFTETEIKQLVSEEDFKKLERVEIDE